MWNKGAALNILKSEMFSKVQQMNPEVARPSFHPTHRWIPWWSVLVMYFERLFSRSFRCYASKASWMRFMNQFLLKIFLRNFTCLFSCVSIRFRYCPTRSSLGSISSKRRVNSSSISGRFARDTSSRQQRWTCHWNCFSIHWKGTCYLVKSFAQKLRT